MNAALNKLYFENEPTELANDDPDFTFDESIFDDAATEILQNGGYTPEMLTKGACNSLVRETFKVLGGGALHGLGKEPDPEMASALRENAFVFSGFKIHNELGEVTNAFKYMPELTDDKGNIRPFHEISKEVDRILADHKIRGINARYNQAYLRAEYNQAVQSAQMAAKYHDALSRKDYINLQYRTANDERVRSEHRKLHGVTLPVDDPFWNDYTPPLGWNCRCTIAEVLKDDYPVSDSTRATSTAERITSAPKDKIFRFNPAKENRVFPRQHPYLPKGCGDCNKGIGSKNLAYDPNSVWCQACKAIAECERKMPIGTQKDSYKNILEYGKKNIIGKVSYTNKAFKGKTAIFTRQSVAHNLGYGELFYAKVDVLNNIKDYLSDIKNLQRVKIEHNEKGNIAAMYEATVKYKGNDTFGKNRDMLLQFKEFVDGTLIFYFIKFI